MKDYLYKMRVLTGILYEATRKAETDKVCVTPLISYKTLPGFTTATQYSTLPFPDPILVSAARKVTGLSGNILIHNLPPLLE